MASLLRADNTQEFIQGDHITITTTQDEGILMITNTHAKKMCLAANQQVLKGEETIYGNVLICCDHELMKKRQDAIGFKLEIIKHEKHDLYDIKCDDTSFVEDVSFDDAQDGILELIEFEKEWWATERGMKMGVRKVEFAGEGSAKYSL